ncbi:MAG: SpoIIE family protein phosphatase [Synergistaceae bacterium]|nr:SpoIIE family protein phosphatase [Synergistaceae bacterium]
MTIRQKLRSALIRAASASFITASLAGIIAASCTSLPVIVAVFAAALALSAFITASLIRRTQKQVADPLAELGREVRDITSNWELDRKITVHDEDDEISDLARSFNEITSSLKDYMQSFGEMIGTNQQVSAELNVAAKIQADMLPKLLPDFPERTACDIYATMTPAKEVGGDFYDFFMLDDDHLALVIADVSDKGVPAALFMVISKTLIKNRALLGGTPGEILHDVNNQLNDSNDEMLFVTVWLGILELSTGRLIASNAGHEHPAVCRAGGSFTLYDADHDPAIAVIPDLEFTEHEFMLKPGDCVYVYTDGVPEANNSDDEQFGTERMIDALNRNAGKSAKDILLSVQEEINGFVKKAPQSDDITMLCLRYDGGKD